MKVRGVILVVFNIETGPSSGYILYCRLCAFPLPSLPVNYSGPARSNQDLFSSSSSSSILFLRMPFTLHLWDRRFTGRKPKMTFILLLVSAFLKVFVQYIWLQTIQRSSSNPLNNPRCPYPSLPAWLFPGGSDPCQGEGGEEPRPGAHGSSGGEGGAQVVAGQHPQRDADTLLLIVLPVSPSGRGRGVPHHGLRERGDVQVPAALIG